MKRIYCLPVLLFAYTSIKAQDSILFKMHYLPMHDYDQTTLQKMTIETSFSGNDSIIEVLKEKGVGNPIHMDKGFNLEGNVTTGKYNSENIMPVQLEFVRAGDNNGNIVIPEGTKMLGTIKEDKMPVLDSIVMIDPNDMVTKNALESAKNILSQISFPVKKMKVGDEYTQNTPVTIPIGAAVMTMNISITYTLTTFTDSFAKFTLNMNAALDMKESNSAFNGAGSGDGSGTMIYDRVNDFPVKYELNYKMELSSKKDDMVIHVALTSNSSTNYKISKL